MATHKILKRNSLGCASLSRFQKRITLEYTKCFCTLSDLSTKSELSETTDKPATDYDLSRYLKEILQAQSKIYAACAETQLQYAPSLSKLLKNKVFLKREDQQPVFSFKLRGAFNKIISIPKETRDKGIVACSAGNHAVTNIFF